MKASCLAISVRPDAAVGSTQVKRARLLGALARQALIAEAELTPKPGLVDRRGSGAHPDLSLDLMRRSALAIEPFICRIAVQSANQRPSAHLRATLAATGRAAESAMLFATGGSNTHRGAIWTLGLLAGSASINETASNALSLAAAAIARTAAKLASFEDSHQLRLISNGQIAAKKFGVSGARGEASEGFPHIINIGLPMLRARRTAHAPEEIARLDALLSIMAELDDTCLLYRGGETALREAKSGATAIIRAGGVGSARGRERLRALDRRFRELGVSPGGSADLLSGVLFLDAVERDQPEIQPDENMLEKDNGTVRI